MTYTAAVTQELIDSTPRKFTESGLFIDVCPLERAIDEQHNLAPYVTGDGKIILWNAQNTPTISIAYSRALDFIKRWRANKSVKPFDFTFEVS